MQLMNNTKEITILSPIRYSDNTLISCNSFSYFQFSHPHQNSNSHWSITWSYSTYQALCSHCLMESTFWWKYYYFQQISDEEINKGDFNWKDEGKCMRPKPLYSNYTMLPLYTQHPLVLFMWVESERMEEWSIKVFGVVKFLI